MKYIKLLIIACCFVTGVSGLVWSQSGNPSTSVKFILRNDSARTLTLAVPSGVDLISYTLTFPPTVGSAGSLPYLINNTGNLGWTGVGTAGQVLSIVGTTPTWSTTLGGGGNTTNISNNGPNNTTNINNLSTGGTTNIGNSTSTTNFFGTVNIPGLTLGLTKDNIFVGNASNTAAQVPPGAAGTVLSVVGTTPTWSSNSIGGPNVTFNINNIGPNDTTNISNPTSVTNIYGPVNIKNLNFGLKKDNIFVGNDSNFAAAVPPGAAGTVLSIIGTTPTWSNSIGGGTNITLNLNNSGSGDTTNINHNSTGGITNIGNNTSVTNFFGTINIPTPNFGLTKDNIFVGNASNTAAAVPPGAAGTVLSIVGTTPTWSNTIGGGTNKIFNINTIGGGDTTNISNLTSVTNIFGKVIFNSTPVIPLPTDNIFRGVAGVATPYSPGAAGQVLSIVGTTPTWGTSIGGGTNITLNLNNSGSGDTTNINHNSTGGITNIGNNTSVTNFFGTINIPGLTGYIVNGTALQPSSNFHISGNGEIEGQLQLKGTGVGTWLTTFQAGAQTTNINYTLPIVAPTAGQILSSNASGGLSWINPANGAGGTVTSVGLSLPSIFTVSGSPVTTSGTLTGTFVNENANFVFAGPTSGAPGVPTFRALLPGDFNNSAWTITGNSGTTPGTNFVGTTDNVAFEVHVNNTGSAGQGNGRVMSYIPNATSANILGGYNGNTISSTIYGATISGGGSNGNIQNILNIYGTIGGGMGNLVCGNYGIVGGGKGNISGGLVSAVLGGESNTANGIGSAIAGGRELWLGDYSFGYNGESGATLTNLSAMSNIAYFGNVDLIIGNVNGTARSLRFYEPNASATYTGANYTSFTAQAQEHDINYTLPATQGAAGTVLQNNGSGILSWADQSAQVGGVRFAIKDSDQTISSSTTLTNDNDLYFTIGANETWELITQMDVATNAADSDAYRFKVAVTIPSGTLHVYASVTNGDGDDDCGGWLTTSGTAQPNAFEINGGDDKGPVLLQGIIVGGTTGGTVHIQWAPSKNMTKTMTVKKNSYLKATKAR